MLSGSSWELDRKKHLSSPWSSNTFISWIPILLLFPGFLSKRDIILSFDNSNTISRIISGILISDTLKHKSSSSTDALTPALMRHMSSVSLVACWPKPDPLDNTLIHLVMEGSQLCESNLEC